MNPAFIDQMSWEMAEVYGAITDQILINLSRYFPYYKAGMKIPKSAFTYQAAMLAQMGKVNRETVKIIRDGLKGADKALQGVLEQAIINSVKKAEPDLLKAVKQGILNPPSIPVVAPNQMRAFQLYYNQAAGKLNLVNTVMLESTQQAYKATVADIATRIQTTQTALDIATGETITGVSAWNEAVKHGIDRLKAGGITGFIDHGNHHWSAEAYVAMDVRTTAMNTGRAAVWEVNQDFGNDLYLVSYHSGARPLCYDWQNKVISAVNNARDVTDIDGNTIHVYAQSDTTYGQAAGLFGINCKHYPSPFIPGVSQIHGQPQSEEANAKTYAESQEQRRLERKLREEKRDLAMMKARGVPEEQLKAQQARIKQSSSDIDEFCKQTGRARHRDREAVYTQREFPAKDTYDVTKFTQDQRNMIESFYKVGGEQQNYKFGEMTPNVPLAPKPVTPVVPVTPTVPVAPVTPVAPVVPSVPQATPSNVAPQVTPPAQKSNMIKMFERNGATPLDVKPLAEPLTSEQIIEKIAGADKTKGSCASVGLAYAGNKAGYDVTDFRGGANQYVISRSDTLKQVAQFPGIDGIVVKGGNDFTIAHELLDNVEEGKEYFFTAGKHAAIVRKTETGYEYLEMQSGWRKNTWYGLNDVELKNRFGCQKSHSTYGMKYEVTEVMFDIDKVKGNSQFEEVLQYINTAADKQKKGLGGGEK